MVYGWQRFRDNLYLDIDSVVLSALYNQQTTSRVTGAEQAHKATGFYLFVKRA